MARTSDSHVRWKFSYILNAIVKDKIIRWERFSFLSIGNHNCLCNLEIQFSFGHKSNNLKTNLSTVPLETCRHNLAEIWVYLVEMIHPIRRYTKLLALNYFRHVLRSNVAALLQKMIFNENLISLSLWIYCEGLRLITFFISKILKSCLFYYEQYI